MREHPAERVENDDWIRRPWVGYLVLALILGAISLHLVLGAIEVLHRPVFPWDAWTNWIYRAKAWFLTGEIVDFDPIELWARNAAPTNRFAVPGAHYPIGLPLLSLGVANVLGFWSDTLINLPAILCGLLLALGSFFVARDYGYPVTISAILAYFVVSIPLVGAHLSLAGMADIWMALVCGLGFGLICSGLIRDRASRWLAGLLLVALSTQIKTEGIVWTLAALLLLAIGLRPRLTLGALAAALLSASIAYGLGARHLDLPLLGTVGVVEGRLVIPYLGSYAIQQYELGADYFSNFLLGGSWNLLWYLVVGALLVALVRLRRARAALVAAAFFTAAAAAHVVIFFFTEQGAWADDWTAINRLPLHFVPALVLVSAFVLLRPEICLERHDGQPVLGAVAATLVAALTIGLLVFLSASPDDLRRQAAVFRGPDALRMAMGTGANTGARLQIERFENNVALISTGRIRVDAVQAPVARIATQGENRRGLTLFWRSGSTGELHRTDLAGLGTLWIDLRDKPGWEGVITELGIVVYDDGGSVAVQSLSLHSPTIAVQARRAIADWRWMAPWSQRSVNWLSGGNPSPLLSPLLLRASLFAALAAMLFVTLRRSGGDHTLAVACAFLALWMVGDLRWVAQRIYLADRTMDTYPFAGSGTLAIGDDRFTAAAVFRATCDTLDGRPAQEIDDIPARITIASDSDVPLDFHVLRAKYHALPTPAHAHVGALADVPTQLSDRILVLKARYGTGGGGVLGSRRTIRQLERRTGRPVHLAWEDENAYLVLLGGEVPVPACWKLGGM